MNKSILENILMQILMNNTGSTTVMLETITSSKVSVKVICQGRITNMKGVKWKGKTIKRETVLFANKTKLSRNVVFINSGKLNSTIKKELFAGRLPIGKIISDMDYRRKIIYGGKVNTLDRYGNSIIPVQIGDYLKIYEIFKGKTCLFLIYEIYNAKNILKFLG